MTINKIVCASLLAVSLSGFSALANANALTIVNNSKQDSTSIINDGSCSSSLPGGVTKHESTNNVPDTIVRIACRGHLSDCKADVYMTPNCNKDGKPKVATVMFDVNKGIQSVTMNSTEYQITGSGFKIQLDGGPKLASK